ncbi:MAG: hypothetical protein ABIU84_06755 [Thermoanaerobaculia bacterium]
MAFTLLARFSGTVVATVALGTFVGTVENGTTPATFVGTVSQGLVAAYNAPCIRTGFRVVLNDVEIPAADLVGFEIKESIDSSINFLDFQLVGARYAVLTNREMWTITPVEVWNVNGPPGSEREELRFTGYVRTASEEGGLGTTVKVSCYDELGRFAEFALCREIEPLSGMTRGAIIAELCADAGLTAVDVPSGAVYTKGIQAKNVKLLDYLRPFAEPEGWKLRMTPRAFADGGGVLKAWSPAIRQAPLAADDVWDLSRAESFRIEPPRGVPSRWVVRGFGAVFVDELGQTTKVQRTEVFDLYAIKVALFEQDTGGSITATGASPGAAELRLVQLIIDTSVARGQKVLSQESEEWGWYNARAAKLVTNTGTGGYDFLAVKIDEDGEYVGADRERFQQLSKSRVTYDYDVDGNATGTVEEQFRYRRRTSGVMQVGDALVSVVSAYVYGDDVSYSTSIETFGLAETHVSTRVFNDETGAEDALVVLSYGYVALKSLIGPGVHSGFYILSNGLGQSELVANWRQYAETRKRNLIADGTLQGTIETQKTLDTARILKDFGTYQWGDYDSNSTTETLLLSHYKRVQFNVLSAGPDGSYEKVTRETGKPPVRETLSGRVPQVRYKASAWTYLAQEPIELIVDDPVVEQLLGFRRETVQNDHIQSLEEAERVVANRRKRLLAYRISVARNESHNRLGATIFLKHPQHSLAHRALLVEATTRRSLPQAFQTADYTFEVPL